MPKQLQILFLVASSDGPSSRVRVLNLLPELKKYNLQCEVKLFPKSVAACLRQAGHLRKPDIIVVQKKLLNPATALIFKANARRLVFDFDDAIFLKDMDGRAASARDYQDWLRAFKFRQTIKSCDWVIAGNAYLAEAARRYHEHVSVLPSAVPCAGIPVKDPALRNDVPIVGWVGSKGTMKYLSGLAPVLLRTFSEVKFDLHVISNEDMNISGIPCRNITWAEATQEAEISRFDIGLMPLPDTPWTRGKCSYKIVQYMAAGVPFVASAVGMNCELAKGEEAGIAVADDDSFYLALKALLMNQERRLEMGRQGRRIALRDYAIEPVARQLANLLCEIG